MSTETHPTHDPHLRQVVTQLQRKVGLLQDRVNLLEEENASLADALREHGVDVHRKSNIHIELPPAFNAPAPGNDEEVALLSKRERRLYDELRGSDTVILLLLSESLADVGQWMLRSRVWLFATPTELVAFASGRRPVVQRVPFQHIQESLYNNVTGELVLAPNRKFKLSRIEISPVEGYQFLAQIFGSNTQNKSTEKTHA
jgi:hypothetical protein